MTPLSRDPAILANLGLLVARVEQQVIRTRQGLERRHPGALRAVVDGDDYVDALKARLRRQVLTAAAALGAPSGPDLARLGALEVLADNLERISDHCESVARGLLRVDGSGAPVPELAPMLRRVEEALRAMPTALVEDGPRVALELCEAERALDDHFAEAREALVTALGGGADPEQSVTRIAIAQSIEGMGDALLNIGEALLSARLGVGVKLERYHVLGAALGGGDPAELELSALGAARSGTEVAWLGGRSAESAGVRAIFKDGGLRKVHREIAGIRRFERRAPGLAPRVHAHVARGAKAGALLEFVPGATLEQLLVRRDDEAFGRATTNLVVTLEALWRSTADRSGATPRFVRELTRRLPELRSVHPDLTAARATVGGETRAPLEQLTRRLARRDRTVSGPCGVLGHGDCNLDNVLFEPDTGRIRFVDLHRAGRMDYLADVAALSVSALRLALADPRLRAAATEFVARIVDAARRFGDCVGDSVLDVRLALGLARGLATSARFVVDGAVAGDLMRRATHLLRAVVALPDEALPTYRIPGGLLRA